MTQLHVIDLVIVAFYLSICVILGFKGFGKIKTLREYALGNKPITTSVLTATVFATAISSSKVIGHIGKSYSMGVMFIFSIFFVSLGWFIMSKLLYKNANFFFRKKFLTMSDIMEYWYGNSAGMLTSIGAVFVSLGAVAIGNMAMGKLIHYFFGIPELWGIIISLCILTFYSTLGGFNAVAFTDVFQFLIFFVALPLAFSVGYNDAGGYKSILKALPKSHLTIEYKDIPLFFSMIAFALMPNADIPYIHRALSARTRYQVKKAFSSVAILMLPFLGMVAFIGLITYVKEPNLQENTVAFYFMKSYLPSGVLGIMIAGLFAIIMSSQDSFLNSASVLISNNIFKRIWPDLSPRKELIVARSATVVIPVLSIGMVFIKKSITETVWFVSNFWEPLIVVPFLAALIGVRINKKMFLIIPSVTLLSQLIAVQIVGALDTRSCAVGIVTAAITTFAVSAIRK